ncbi:MAG: PAS domain-containing sensor histidine kinase [Cyanobacteria bacterium REEB65]|nr:PAS domain-containing sensor histidine kinase [Cyanobacteria bacterium REEB65]
MASAKDEQVSFGSTEGEEDPVGLFEAHGVTPERAFAGVRDITAIANVLLDSAVDSIFVVNGKGLIEFANQTAIRTFGYEQEALLGQSIELLVPERFKREHALLREGFMTSPRSRPMGVGLDLLAIRKDGTEFPVDISLSPVKTSLGLLVMAIVSDASEIRAAAQERIASLEREKRRIDQLLDIISHELRTPVAIAKGMLENLLDERVLVQCPPEVRQHLSEIEKATHELAQKVESVIHLSTRQARKIRGNVCKVDLVALIAAAKKDLLPLLEAKRLELEVHLERPVPEAVADPDNIRRILSNLLSNAIKVSPESSTIEISVWTQGDFIVCEVVDRGPGIAEEDLANLFQPLTQLDMSSTRRLAGLGIGLSIVRELVQAHHGQVGVASKVGEGSRFWFTIPIPREGEFLAYD